MDGRKWRKKIAVAINCFNEFRHRLVMADNKLVPSFSSGHPQPTLRLIASPHLVVIFLKDAH